MTAYAMIVVIEAPNAEKAWDVLHDAVRGTPEARYVDEAAPVGDPWEVHTPAERNPVFDTPTCIEQHGKRGES